MPALKEIPGIARGRRFKRPRVVEPDHGIWPDLFKHRAGRMAEYQPAHRFRQLRDMLAPFRAELFSQFGLYHQSCVISSSNRPERPQARTGARSDATFRSHERGCRAPDGVRNISK